MVRKYGGKIVYAKQMKVIFTIDALINAGTEKSILDITSVLSQRMEVKVIYFYPRHDLKESFEAARVPLKFMNLSGKRSFFMGIKKLRKVLNEEKPDIVVSSILRANLMSRIACKLTKTKLVGTFISDSYSAERQTSFSGRRKMGAYFFYWLDRITAGIPLAWISNSQSIKKSNTAFLKVDTKIVQVIYRGRDPVKFKRYERAYFDGCFKFVFMGRLLQTKGLEELIEAFNLVLERFPAIELDIYGEGSFRNQLTQKITDLGLDKKIILHGAVANGWKKLYDADCFIFPSWYEGFSGSLVEAMMVGIPIIASDIPMNLEAVTNEKTALIHRVKDKHSIAEQMITMVTGYGEMIGMGQLAREEALQRFDIKIIVNQYESFLRMVSTKSCHNTV